jgi:hypothetical protein
MTYFLDFDRTLFDTDAFNVSLADEPGCAPFADELRAVVAAGRDATLTGGDVRVAAWAKVSDAIKNGTLVFAPGYLSKFLYKDAPEFLRMLGSEAIIVTYGDPVLQRAKVESALAGVVRRTVLYTGSISKSEYLASWPGYFGAPAQFVDDRVTELEGLAQKFPNMTLFEMRRDGGKGDGRFKVIGSLSEV